MRNTKTIFLEVTAALFLIHSVSLAACPSADLTGDCRVDAADFAVMASQWLFQGVPDDPNVSMEWVYINDPGVEGHEGFVGEMSKYETTNAQFCAFLNAALASGDITVSGDRVYGADGTNEGADFVGEIYFETYDVDSDSQIIYGGGVFSVRSRDGYDMSDHPVVELSWWGATAFCNYYGWRLPTIWEWIAVADYDGTFNYGCGTTIDYSKANYEEINPVGLSSRPYTSPVGYYPAYGYGLCDMTGNVNEWTSFFDYENVICGGSWKSWAEDCLVLFLDGYGPDDTGDFAGFRVCR